MQGQWNRRNDGKRLSVKKSNSLFLKSNFFCFALFSPFLLLLLSANELQVIVFMLFFTVEIRVLVIGKYQKLTDFISR